MLDTPTPFIHNLLVILYKPTPASGLQIPNTHMPWTKRTARQHTQSRQDRAGLSNNPRRKDRRIHQEGKHEKHKTLLLDSEFCPNYWAEFATFFLTRGQWEPTETLCELEVWNNFQSADCAHCEQFIVKANILNNFPQYNIWCDVVPSDDVLQVFATYSGCLLLDGRALCFPDTRQTANEKSKYHITYTLHLSSSQHNTHLYTVLMCFNTALK